MPKILNIILYLIPEDFKNVTHIYTCRYIIHTTYNSICKKELPLRAQTPANFFSVGFENNSIK